MNRGEVWWVQFDPSIGSEIRKRRPGIILSNSVANQHLSRVVVVPITSNVDRVYPSEALISVTGKAAKAMADQIMAADKSRLDGRMATLSREDLAAVEQAVKLHLGMSPNT
jgi:mRNA interferase MazF|tara:strand:- start:307 stop:639 length:333 start_codon:yes stop_codon:yes gene_type:complete